MIAGITHSEFRKLNAVSSGIQDIRKIVEEAAEQRQVLSEKNDCIH